MESRPAVELNDSAILAKRASFNKPQQQPMTITHRTATMRKLSTLLASTSLVTTHAFLYTHVFSSYLSSTAGNSLSANKSYKLSHSEFRSGSRNSKCARMNQTRDNSSSNERITLESMVESLKKGDYKNILIVAGAGVSCSAGIPDVS